MKIGIITYHFAHNFGAVLQCYSLQEFLKRHGYDVEIINYCPEGLTRYYTVFSNPFKAVYYRYVALRNQGMKKKTAITRASFSIVRVIKDNKRFWFRYKRKLAFEQFSKKYLNLTKKYSKYEDLEENCKSYDALICGSDQIWNVKLLNDTFDKSYFLSFADHKQILLSYAPSFGETDPRLFPEVIKEYLARFRAISVREKHDVSKLESVLKRKVTNALDPVFLAIEEDFQKITHSVKVKNEPYILIYTLSDDEKIFEVVKKHYSNYKVVDISPIDIIWNSSTILKEQKRNIGPDEFVALIMNSQCVLTNSFHGTAISIILHKRFYAFPLRLRNERLQNVLEITNLHNRFVYNIDDIDINDIDYSSVDNLLDKARSESITYLLRTLEGVYAEEAYVPATVDAHYNELRNGEECCGCGVCVSVCMHDAIALGKDGEGFSVPIVDSNKCINCGLCVKACNMTHDRSKDHGIKRMFAFQNSKEVRLRSASGGAWKALAMECIAGNGSAVGAAWSKDFLSVSHIIAKSEEDVKKQSGSKYIEGLASGTFSQIEALLKQQKEIIFSGTPCQCSALRTFLGIHKVDMSKLVIVDLICHGKSSPSVWAAYVRYIEKTYQGKIVSFTYRDKSQSWSGIHEKVIFDDGRRVVLTPQVHTIGKIMETECMLRPACYNCPFTKLERVGDITIGDFWGIEKELPYWDNSLGTSIIFANTEVGLSFLSRLQEDDFLIQEIFDLKTIQPNLRVPTRCPSNRPLFWEKYRDTDDETGFIEEYSRLKKTDILKMKIKKVLYKET